MRVRPSAHPSPHLHHAANNRKVSLWRQTMLLVSRFYRTTFRDPKMFWTNILMVVGTVSASPSFLPLLFLLRTAVSAQSFFGDATLCSLACMQSLMMGVIMLRMSTDQVGIQDRFAALYLLSTMAPYNMMVANIVNCACVRAILFFSIFPLFSVFSSLVFSCFVFSSLSISPHFVHSSVSSPRSLCFLFLSLSPPSSPLAFFRPFSFFSLLSSAPSFFNSFCFFRLSFLPISVTALHVHLSLMSPCFVLLTLSLSLSSLPCMRLLAFPRR